MATQTLTSIANRGGGNPNLFATKPVLDPTRARAERTKNYKDFLTPALHRRFCAAAGLTLLVCWSDSYILSNSSSWLWSWFPLGPAGARTILLFMPCLMVFIVRLANMHMGDRTSLSMAQTVLERTTSRKGIANTLHTMFWYIVSGWFFGELYIWSRSDQAELGIIDQGRAYERPRLNENPIALRCLFITLATVQSVLHMARDYDQVAIGQQKKDMEDNSAMASLFGAYWNKMPGPLKALLARAKSITTKSVNLAIIGVLTFPLLVYYPFLRGPAWRWTYFFAKIFFSQLPSEAPPTGLLHIWKLIRQAGISSIMLVSLWEVSNAVFDICTVQPPLKRGEPLTSEIRDGRGALLHRSLDPNGSLISGLKSKKEVTKSFALWELSLITSEFEQRRKTIYTEVDRKDSSTWSQICAVCIGEVNGIAERIAAELAPAEYKSQQAAEEEQKRQQSLIVAQQNPGLRKIADHRVIDDGDVFVGGQPPDFYNMVGTLAKSFGQYPGSQNPVTPRARKAIEYATDHVLSKEYQVRFRPQDIEKRATGYVAEVLKSPIGLPFRQTFARKIAATIFGTPISNKTNIIHATLVLQKLSVLSLIEDDFGQVQKDIPAIIRTFTAVIQKVETFLRSSAPHWTDVEFMEERDRHVAEVDEVLDVIKAALEEILLKFGEYADALEITKKELREAREASQRLCSRPLVMEEEIAAEIAPAAEVERRSAAGTGRPEMKERRRWGQ